MDSWAIARLLYSGVERISDEQLEGLDLSSLRVAFVGAERVRVETLRRFAEKFARCGFREEAFFPCYGLGEATLIVSGGPVSAPPVVRTVSASALLQRRIENPADPADEIRLCASGQTIDGCEVVIVDEQSMQPIDDEVIGEVLVNSPAVTPGYFRRPELNEKLFCDITMEGRTRTFLRTGDLGFFFPAASSSSPEERANS